MIDDSSETCLTVGTFNLLNYAAPPQAYYDFENIYSGPDWQEKQRWTGHQLAQAKPDIIGFQEVFSPSALKTLAQVHDLPYFATIEAPHVKQDYVLDKPVVALASRFPIQQCEAVSVPTSMLEAMHLPPEFNFSRGILRAVVRLPLLGDCWVYVLHLKSKRPTLSGVLSAPEAVKDSPPAEPDWQTDIAQALIQHTLGGWASTLQRGSEVACLYYDIIQQRCAGVSAALPVMVLGDFNDEIGASALQHLVNSHTLWMVGETTTSALPMAAKTRFDHFALHDSHQLIDGNPTLLQSHTSNLSESQKNHPARQPSHYFANQGNVLDYILLSNDFNASYQQSMASVIEHHTFNGHLLNPIFEYDRQASDHAMVTTKINIRF